MSPIDTDKVSPKLRERGIDTERRTVLVSRLTGSEQEKDLTEPANCEGIGRIRHFRRETHPDWPENPLPIEPAARYLRAGDGAMLRAQVFQNAVCNWRCWYCYVDFPLLSGNSEHSEMRSADELLDLYLQIEDRPQVIDLSGGQPDLVPEWAAWMIEGVRDRGLSAEVYLWSDDNLSNDYFWTKLDAEQRDLISSCAGYGKVCCFKGYDDASFAFNTAATSELFDRQFELMRRLVSDTEIDLYAYATFTSPHNMAISEKMATFIDRLQELDEHLPLRLVPLRVGAFTPVQARGLSTDHERALVVQDEAIAAWNTELASRFDEDLRRRSICDVPLRG